MSYPLELAAGRIQTKGSGNATAEVLSAAADHGEDLCMDGINLYEISFLVTIVTVGAATVTFTRRPLPGSATGETVIGTVIVPGGTAAGATVIKEVDVRLNRGDAIEFSVSSAGTSGAGYYGYKCSLCPEDHRESTEVTLSA